MIVVFCVQLTLGGPSHSEYRQHRVSWESRFYYCSTELMCTPYNFIKENYQFFLIIKDICTPLPYGGIIDKGFIFTIQQFF